jgi:hypothetical protein
MKKIIGSLVILSFLLSCSSDDSLPQLPVVTFNEFTYGDDTTENVMVRNCYNRNALFIATGVSRTDVFITSEGFTINDSEQIEGTGFLIDIDLLGNAARSLQLGTYNIDPAIESGNAQINFSENFDTAATLNNSIDIESGIITVSAFRTGYLIEINGTDAMGNEFHGSYLGNTALIF